MLSGCNRHHWVWQADLDRNLNKQEHHNNVKKRMSVAVLKKRMSVAVLVSEHTSRTGLNREVLDVTTCH
jgi:hypothetical protein